MLYHPQRVYILLSDIGDEKSPTTFEYSNEVYIYIYSFVRICVYVCECPCVNTMYV